MTGHWARFDLRIDGGAKRVLMIRNAHGTAWRDVAVFASYNDAELVLDLLRRAIETYE